MTTRSADRHEQHAAAALRRMVAAYHDGSLSKTAYRERRARLLEAVTRGRPLRQSVAPREEPAAAVAWALPAGALLVLLALIAIGWWLLH